jgi:hypothetical protein
MFAKLVKQKLLGRTVIRQLQQLATGPNRLRKIETAVVYDDPKLGTFAVPGVLVIHAIGPFSYSQGTMP